MKLIDTITSYIQTQRFPIDIWRAGTDSNYWFNWQPTTNSPYYLFGFCSVGLIIAILLIWTILLSKKNKTTPVFQGQIDSIINLVIYIILMTLIIYFMRIWQIAYLSSPLCALLAVIAGIGWLANIWRIHRFVTPVKIRKHLEKERFFRYLPNNGRKEK